MTYRVFLVAASLVALAGCDAPGFSRKAKAPDGAAAMNANKPPVVGTTQTTSAMLPTSQKPVFFTDGLSVSDVVARECGLKPREAANETNPTFDFDSSALAPADRDLLADVAKCMTEGALRGKNVQLVGRTDARGESEYNMGLGDSRSTAVQRYMVDLGVGKDRLHATSRGEMDAVGKDEAGYARDRRVDIELAL
jgi:peptidoglycan-associated lipoprotein